jgi:uncharacterized protein
MPRAGNLYLYLLHLPGMLLATFRWVFFRLIFYLSVAVASVTLLIGWAAIYTYVWPGRAVQPPIFPVENPSTAPSPTRGPDQSEPKYEPLIAKTGRGDNGSDILAPVPVPTPPPVQPQTKTKAVVAEKGGINTTEPRVALNSLPSPATPLHPGESARTTNITSLEYAAEKGDSTAQWRLGHMYMKGEGVPRSDARAFSYFESIANSHAADGIDTPNARTVASAIVAVGRYYLDGIPDSHIKADPARARLMFFHAASNFRDPDAQYLLGRLLLDGSGGAREPVQAARWLKLAANKDQHAAQALLGEMLIKGEVVPRHVARGLMYLILAREASPEDQSIGAAYQQAFAQATPDDRSAARIYLHQWVSGVRD